MSQSPNLSLPYLLPNQAQKHVTLNEALRQLDVTVQLSVVSATLTAPPASPQAGEVYLVPTGASGAWSGQEGKVAAWQDDAWEFQSPKNGWRAWDAETADLKVFTGGSWTSFFGEIDTSPLWGVNATADLANRLSVSSPSILFDAEADDINLSLNRTSSADEARISFQTGFSPGALVGLLGNNNFTLKVTPDGVSYYSALIADATTGNIGLGHNPIGDRLEVRDGLIASFSNGSASSAAHTNAGFKLYTDNAPYHAVMHPYRGTTSSRTGISFHVAGAAPPAEAMRLTHNGLVIGVPSGGEKGPGTLNAQAIYDDNALLSCYVFDQAVDGSINEAKWDARAQIPHRPPRLDDEADLVQSPEPEQSTHMPMRRFRSRLGSAYDPLTLDGYARHWKEKRHLTALPNEETFDSDTGLSTGEWIQRLVETVEIQAVLIEALNERTRGRDQVALPR